MNSDAPFTEFEIDSGPQRGGRLVLHEDRLVHGNADTTEIVPLAHLAAVRVSFARDAAKLNWAIVLLVGALALFAASGPLQRAMAAAAAKFGDAVRPESLDAVLLGAFNALGAGASLLPAFAAAMAAGAVALLAYFWLGATTLTLAFAATERAFTVRGRNPLLVQFAGAVADRLTVRAEKAGRAGTAGS
jgi:hypothetical protein